MKRLKILPLALMAFFVSCETEELDGTTTNENSLDNTASLSTSIDIEASIGEADDILDDIAIYSGRFFGLAGNDLFGKRDRRRGRSGFFRECANIDTQETENSITVTITFNGECEDENGNAITGTVVKEENFTDTDTENTLTITDLVINGYTINGSKTFTWVESNINGNPQMTGTVQITAETSEGIISKSGSKTVEITEGGDTDTWVDNVKTITGSFEYQGFDESVTMEITTPLVKPAACKFIVSGVKTYTTAEGTSTLDFGDGTCDGLAILTLFDGTQEEIALRRNKRDGRDSEEENEDDEVEDEEGGEDEEEEGEEEEVEEGEEGEEVEEGEEGEEGEEDNGTDDENDTDEGN